MDVALMVAKDRQDLQTRDKVRAKKVKERETALKSLNSQLRLVGNLTRRLQDDIDGLLRRNVYQEWVSRCGHNDADDDGWLRITLDGARRQLRDERHRAQELKRKVATLESELLVL